MGKGALRPFFKGHSLKKEKEHEKKEVDKMLSHFVTLPFYYVSSSITSALKTMATSASEQQNSAVPAGCPGREPP